MRRTRRLTFTVLTSHQCENPAYTLFGSWLDKQRRRRRKRSAGNQKDRNRPHLYLFLSFPFVFCNLFLWSFKEASSSVIARILCLKAKAILSEDYQAVNHCLILVKWAPEKWGSDTDMYVPARLWFGKLEIMLETAGVCMICRCALTGPL